MGGLLTKEFLYLKKQGKTFLLMIAFYAVLFLFMGGNKYSVDSWSGIIIVVMIMLTVFLSINTVAYDEAAKWDGFVKSLPVGAGTIVGAKYLFIAIFSGLGAVFSAAVYFIIAHGQIQPRELAAVCVGSGAPPLIFCSILLPLFYKFGLQKTRIALMIMFLFPTAVVLMEKNGLPVPDAQALLLLRLSPVILLIVVAASFLISCRIYQHREV